MDKNIMDILNKLLEGQKKIDELVEGQKKINERIDKIEAEVKGEIKSIKHDLSKVEIITTSNSYDIAKLKAIK
ncbi:hypothetical protein [Crassaminicella indica]|uniref:Uncharacterized protein n=1 Tax=Crassaminicella indica TaxID=2855394 RepID=A0ABX8R8A5_9CLOT|nr:hypothetical protein [Crassaminicella indica]QXM05263.1 hypothetical protein KVH43_07610 [Crassaminicella indica]